MHPDFERASGLTNEVIAAAIEVHRDKGPGLMESVYEWCFCRELELRGIPFTTQQEVEIRYKGFVKQESLRFDLLIDGCLLVEVKAVENVLPIHKAQLLSYMKLLNVPVGLLVNFHALRVVDGVRRLILKDALQVTDEGGVMLQDPPDASTSI